MTPVFGHGQLRLYLLAALDGGPRHGYELIQELEERFRGLYSPSPGTIYPRLAKLEDEGLVRRRDEGRKSLYELTLEGREELGRRGGEVQGLEASLDHSVQRLADTVRARVHSDTEDLRAEMHAAARDARRTAREEPPVASAWPVDAEALVSALRRQVRQARRRTLSADQASALVEVIRDAARKVDEILSGTGRGVR